MSRNRKRNLKSKNRSRRLVAALEWLEPRQLLAGVTPSDLFALDAVGAVPAIQSGDVGTGWTVQGTPDVGTGSATSGSAKPLDVDIGGDSKLLRLDGSGESAQARFSEITSLNGSNDSDADFESGFDIDGNGSIDLIDFAGFRGSFGNSI